MTRVVAAILERNGRVFICRRRPDQPHPLKWEFPGGKLEAGESPERAAARELDEEIGIRVEQCEEVRRYEFAYPGKPAIELIFVRVGAWSGEIENRIFEQVEWAERERLRDYDFLEGDLPFLSSMC